MLNTVSLDEAKKTVDGFDINLSYEEIPLLYALGRTVFEDTVSTENVPAFDRSTVDGYAVKSEAVYGATESMPSMLNIKANINMGEAADFEIFADECAEISTGGMLPRGADSVIMVENTEKTFDGMCLAYKPVSPFENVTKKGDDIKKGETVVKKGTLISPHVMGVLAAAGQAKVKVIKKAVVGIISTGNEVTDISVTPKPGQVRDVNTYLLSALCSEAGCETKIYGIIKDDFELLKSTVEKAVSECDTVLLSGGSSAGEKDLTAKVFADLGKVLVHGIAMKPGKPTVIGEIDKKPVFGLPGHPAAAYFTFTALVKPLLHKMSGKELVDKTEKYILKTNISSNNGREEFVSVKLENGFAIPVFSKSGIISLLSKTDGYTVIGKNSEGLDAGETVLVHLR